MDEERFRKLAAPPTTAASTRPGVARQLHAITRSGDRTKALRRLQRPGRRDPRGRDPLIRSAAGRATARAIPGARLRDHRGMGHDLPPQVWPVLVEEIDGNVLRAERAGAVGSPQPTR